MKSSTYRTEMSIAGGNCGMSLAAFYDLPIAEPLAMSTVSEMSEKAPLWDSMVARYGLHATPYEQIANWAFADWMLNFREETILSTIKIRQAGFADCIDTHQSFRRQLTRLRGMRIIPCYLQDAASPN